MPNYKYSCEKCQTNFSIKASLKEKEQSDSKIFVCPNCQSQNIKQDYGGISVYKNNPKKNNPGSGCCSGCCHH